MIGTLPHVDRRESIANAQAGQHRGGCRSFFNQQEKNNHPKTCDRQIRTREIQVQFEADLRHWLLPSYQVPDI
jgi:hypothetical protein